MFKSRDARTKLRGMGGILASSPELAQTVQKFQDGGNVDGGFGSNVEYTYSTFLAENNLNDTPQAREMFAKYKVYMDTREAPSSPKLFSSVGFDRAPAAPGVAPMTSAVEFDPNRRYSRPDMPSAPAGLAALSVEPDAAFTRQTSPAAPVAPAEPISTLDQLRGSVYSTGPLEALGQAYGEQAEVFAPYYKAREDQEAFRAVGESFDNNALLSSGRAPSVLDELRGNVYSTGPLEAALAGTGLNSNVIGDYIINPITGRIKEIFAEDAARNERLASGDIDLPFGLGSEELMSPDPVRPDAAPLSSGSPVIDTSSRRGNVDIAYGGSGDLYQKGFAGQMSAVRSLSDGELLSIVGDPSNSLYGVAVEEMAKRGMDFGEKPVIAAQKISRDAERRLFAAQEQLRAATTSAERLAAEAAIRDAEAGVQEATLNQENTPRSVLEPAVDLTPSELLAQELGMDYVPGSETPVVEAPAADTATETPVVEVPAAGAATETPAPVTTTETETEPAAPVVTEEVVKKVADPKIQEQAAALAPSPDDTEDDLRTKYEARAKLFQEILGEDEAGARNKGMDLAMIGLAIMSGQSPNALTNIALGGAAGLKAMSARDEAARERQRLIRTTALESVIDEEAAATDRAATAAEKELDRANVLAAARIRSSGTATQAAARNLANIADDASKAAGEVYNDPAMRATSDVKMDEKGKPLETESQYRARKALEQQTLAQVMNPAIYGTSPAIKAMVKELLKNNDKSLVRSELLRKYPAINPADYGL